MSSIDLDHVTQICRHTNNTLDKESDESLSLSNSPKRIWKINCINTGSHDLITEKPENQPLKTTNQQIYLRARKRKSEWTIEEENLIFQLHKENGNMWTEISKLIPSKHHNEIKNYFYCKVRKLVRMLIGKVINEEIRGSPEKLGQILYLLDFIKSEYLINLNSSRCKDRYLNNIIKSYSLNVNKVEEYKKLIISSISGKIKNDSFISEKESYLKPETCIVSAMNSDNKKKSENELNTYLVDRLPLPRNFFNPKFKIQPLEQPNYDLLLFPYSLDQNISLDHF